MLSRLSGSQQGQPRGLVEPFSCRLAMAPVVVMVGGKVGAGRAGLAGLLATVVGPVVGLVVVIGVAVLLATAGAAAGGMGSSGGALAALACVVSAALELLTEGLEDAVLGRITTLVIVASCAVTELASGALSSAGVNPLSACDVTARTLGFIVTLVICISGLVVSTVGALGTPISFWSASGCTTN